MKDFDKKLKEYLMEWSGAEQLDVSEMVKDIKALILESMPSQFVQFNETWNTKTFELVDRELAKPDQWTKGFNSAVKRMLEVFK